MTSLNTAAKETSLNVKSRICQVNPNHTRGSPMKMFLEKNKTWSSSTGEQGNRGKKRLATWERAESLSKIGRASTDNCGNKGIKLTHSRLER